MLLKARIDALGALHHIIFRGIEGRRIFSGDQERDNFINRLADIVTETKTIHSQGSQSMVLLGGQKVELQCHRLS